jgi:hypothetical protein
VFVISVEDRMGRKGGPRSALRVGVEQDIHAEVMSDRLGNPGDTRI